MAKYGDKVIFEHNTIEATEIYGNYKEKIKETGLRFSPGFPFWVFDRLLAPLINEKFWGRRVRSKARGGVGVADEIRDYQVSRCPDYDCRIVYNGIDYSSVPLIERSVATDPGIIKCFMLSGHPLFWHGVDRLITGLESYKGNVNFKIDLYGSYLPSVVESIKKSKMSSHFRILKYINSGEMNEKLKEYDFAFGSLAPHRTGMMEATPLKVRETLARGFPLVKAYIDPVLDKAVELKPFIQTLPIDDTPLNFAEVENFVRKIRETSIQPQAIRDLSAKYLEMHYMMKMLGDAITGI